MKIFTNDEWEELSLYNGIPHLGYYRPYYMPDGSINPEFRKEKLSGLILDLKEKRPEALDYFFNMINDEICENITICVVPSHSKSTTNESGIALLARRLAASKNRIDKVDFLIRDKNILKLSTGGLRNEFVHKNSIIANPCMSIKGDVILLIDDITTSGTSLTACKQILMGNGASRVAMFALGETT